MEQEEWKNWWRQTRKPGTARQTWEEAWATRVLSLLLTVLSGVSTHTHRSQSHQCEPVSGLAGSSPITVSRASCDPQKAGWLPDNTSFISCECRFFLLVECAQGYDFLCFLGESPTPRSHYSPCGSCLLTLPLSTFPITLCKPLARGQQPPSWMASEDDHSQGSFQTSIICFVPSHLSSTQPGREKQCLSACSIVVSTITPTSCNAELD